MRGSSAERPFDPLYNLDGLWTVELAHRYLPIEGMLPARYEAVDGTLKISPRGGSATSWATAQLIGLLGPAALTVEHALYPALYVRTGLSGWIEPDLVLLREHVRQQTWIEAEQVLCPIEIISPSSFHRDRIDKPAICARQGIPFYMHVQIGTNDVEIELFRLVGGQYTRHARAKSGEIFRMSEPFAFSFDPDELLEAH